jgi:hypothetical protein
LTINAADKFVQIPFGPGNSNRVPTYSGQRIFPAFLLSGWNQEIAAGGVITGPAPLVVHFDAVGTDHANTQINGFLDMFYHWNFGYTSTASQSVWSTTALPKGQQIGGPLAAHCFDKAGTYTCSVRIQDSFGVYSDKYATVVVRSADDVFSAANTVCISQAGNFTGAPSGATTTTTPPTTVTSNTRYLYRMDEDFSTFTLSIAHSKSNVLVGSFGTGTNKPKVWKKLVQTPPKNTDVLLNSITFMDLNVDDMDIPFANYVSFIRCESFSQSADDPYVAGCGETVAFYYQPANLPANTNQSDIKWPKNCAWISNLIDGKLVTGNSVGIRGNRPIILGNQIKDPQEHDIRMHLGYKSVITHNTLGKLQNNTKHHIKYHSSGTGNFTEDYGSSNNPQSKYGVIADNYNEEDSANWIYALSPQNNSSAELVSYILLERNQFTYASGDTSSKVFQILSGYNLSVRDYTLSGTVTSRRIIGFDAFSNAIGLSALSPYYVPAGNTSIDGSRIFTATGVVTPMRAGS